MRRNLWLNLLLIGVGVAALSALALTVPRPASARPASRVEAPLSGAAEAWKLGFTLEGTADYGQVAGRLASPAAALRSNAGVSDVYFVLPPSALTKTVQSAQVYLVQRNGAYVGSATLSLQVFTLGGTLQRTVSASAIDAQTASLGAWTSVPLSTTPANLTIAPGEFLAFHLALSSGSGGDLDVRPVFEVVVQ